MLHESFSAKQGRSAVTNSKLLARVWASRSKYFIFVSGLRHISEKPEINTMTWIPIKDAK